MKPFVACRIRDVFRSIGGAAPVSAVVAACLAAPVWAPVFLVPALLAEEAPAPLQSSLNEVIIVTATRSEKRLEEAPGVGAVVTQDAMAVRNVKTIDQAINTVPGVFNRRGKGVMDTQAAIALRGFPDQKRTLVLLDGVAMNDSYTGGVQWGGLAAESIERIEVVKGPFSSLYGGDAMGGVVNIISKMPGKREWVVRGGYGGGWGTREAMNDTARGYVSYGETFRDKFGVFISYGRHRSNGYANDLNVQSVRPPEGITGYRETVSTQDSPRYIVGDKGDNRWSDHDFRFRASYRANRAVRIGFSFASTAYRYENDAPHSYLKDGAGRTVYAYARGGSRVYEAGYLAGAGNKRQDMFGVSLDAAIGRALVKSYASFMNIHDNWYTTPGSTAATSASGGPGTLAETPVRRIAFGAQVVFPIRARHLLTAGTDFTGNTAETTEHALSDWRDRSSRTSRTYNARGKTLVSGFYLQDEVLLSSGLTAYFGLRGDYWRTYGGYADQVGMADYPIGYGSRDSFSLSPKAALVYRPSETTTLKGSVGRVFRAPTVYELYRTWSYASGTVYRGNPDLDPETALSWDVSIDRSLWTGGTVSASYFENRMSGLIYRRTHPDNFRVNEYINAGKALGRGVEMGIAQSLFSRLRFFANGTFNSAKITENEAKSATEGKSLTYIPRWMANAGAEYSRGRVTAGFTGRYVSKLYTHDENKDEVNGVPGAYDPHFTADVKMLFRATRLFSLSFSIDNIFNRKYFYSYLAPGRSAYAEIVIHWKE